MSLIFLGPPVEIRPARPTVKYGSLLGLYAYFNARTISLSYTSSRVIAVSRYDEVEQVGISPAATRFR